jgi:sRNA-binding regulator protein Hfq
MEPGNRKLIRPALVEVKEQPNVNRRNNNSSSSAPKKTVPPEQTNAENFYYLKQMQAKTPMVILLRDGETIEGSIEWYDRNCLKIHRDNGPNLLLYKQNIKYMYKA